MVTLDFLHNILILLINIGAITLGVTVYRKDPFRRINRLFFVSSFFMLGWVNFAYLARLSMHQNLDFSLLFLKIAWLITPLFFSLLYFLIVNIITDEHQKKYRILNKIVILGGCTIALITTFSNSVLKEIIVTDGSLKIVYGNGVIGYLGFGIFLIISTLLLLLKGYFNLSPEKKLKIQYLFIGLVIFYLANFLFNIFFPIFLHRTDLYYLGDYSTIILLFFMTYAIVKRKLFGIKVVLTQLLVGFIAILLLVNIVNSKTPLEYGWKGVLFLLFLFFGYLLIRGSLREARQKEILAKMVDEKTEELRKSNKELEKSKGELEKWYKATVGRELRMIELKKEIKKRDEEKR